MERESEPDASADRSQRVDRRDFLRASGTIALGTAAGCLGGGRSKPLKIGYIPITDAAPLLVASAKGFFEEEGLTTEEPTLYRGWSTLASAFQSGDVNAGHFLFPMTYWMRYGLGYPATVLGWDHTNGSAITVASDVDSWDDLRGARMAVPYWYSTHNVILQMVLRQKGLEPVLHREAVSDDQVALIDLAPPSMPPALSRGEIKGYIVAEPFNALAEIKTDAKIHRFTADIWFRHGDCVLTVAEPAVRNRPDWTRSLTRAVVRAQRWIGDHRAEAAQVLSKEGSGLLPYSRSVIDRSLNLYDPDAYPDAIKHPDWNAERVGFYGYPYPSYTKALYEQTQQTKLVGKTDFLDEVSPQTVAEEVVDPRFVRDAIGAFGGPSAFDIPQSRAYEREERIDI
ncbi:MAG: ABC transporter substrate-binding protein [Halobellus sp.]